MHDQPLRPSPAPPAIDNCSPGRSLRLASALLAAFLAPHSLAATVEPAPRLYVQDGQLVSHAFVVFVNRQVEDTMNPRLRLQGGYVTTRPTKLEHEPQKPTLVAPRQARSFPLDKQNITVEGTVLTFDFSQADIPWFKSAIRLRPILEWDEPPTTDGKGAKVAKVVGHDELFLGYMPGAWLWTGLTLGLIVSTILVWSVVKSQKVAPPPIVRPLLFLITGSDGYLSLWRLQLCVWTLAIGTMVFLFGVLRLKVPEIPESLVALMGLSTLTGLGAAKAGAPAPAAAVAGGAVPAPPLPNPGTAQWSDLISIFNATTQRVELSVPKAQMLLWTILIIVLFMAKSILEGVLWEIPWAIVLLTGVSQAGYVGDKIAKS